MRCVPFGVLSQHWRLDDCLQVVRRREVSEAQRDDFVLAVRAGNVPKFEKRNWMQDLRGRVFLKHD